LKNYKPSKLSLSYTPSVAIRYWNNNVLTPVRRVNSVLFVHSGLGTTRPMGGSWNSTAEWLCLPLLLELPWNNTKWGKCDGFRYKLHNFIIFLIHSLSVNRFYWSHWIMYSLICIKLMKGIIGRKSFWCKILIIFHMYSSLQKVNNKLF
jgi:hypothetical protein